MSKTRADIEEMVRCAQANFENFERLLPMASRNPIYRIAKHQLDEAVKAIDEDEAQPCP